jgi:hypothetical protein
MAAQAEARQTEDASVDSEGRPDRGKVSAQGCSGKAATPHAERGLSAAILETERARQADDTATKAKVTMRQFTVTTEGQNRLGLRELCQRFADEQWVADHLTSAQAAESILREFKRAVRAELEMLDLKCKTRRKRKP